MKARRSLLLQLLAFLLAVGMSLLTWPFLRGMGPVGPTEPLLFSPLWIAGTLGASVLIVRGRSAPAAGVLAGFALIAGWFVLEHGVVLAAAMTRGFSPVRPALALVFGLFVGLAPIIRRVEQNPWFGVRTPWTMGSRRVWRETHQATGKLWLVGGIVGSALTMFGAPFLFVMAFLLALGLGPVAISYSVWRRLGRTMSGDFRF